MNKHFYLALFMTLLATLNGAALAALAAPADSFQSRGKAIRLEWFPPLSQLNTKSKKPLLLILHGSGGLDEKGGFFRDIAAELAKRGHNTVVVHYFDQTGNSYASSADMARYFSVWLRTVGGAVGYCKKQTFVDANKVSILGHSLGAQLALQAAAQDRDICSVIDMSGCFVLPVANLKTMPPILILHGKADTVVPLSKEKNLVATLKRIGSPYEEHLFPGADHAFNKVSFEELISLSDKFLSK
jgi:dienelactone hydrolase